MNKKIMLILFLLSSGPVLGMELSESETSSDETLVTQETVSNTESVLEVLKLMKELFRHFFEM